MVEALRHVQDAGAVEGLPRSVEHSPVGFVCAHVLRGDDMLERGPERFSGSFEDGVVDVGDDRQVRGLAEAREGCDGVRERRPVARALGEGVEHPFGGREGQTLAEAAQDFAEHIGVGHPVLLYHRLGFSEELEQEIIDHVGIAFEEERLQVPDHAGTPVDQRTVAVEG